MLDFDRGIFGPVHPRWFARFFGGNFRQLNGGYGWRPSALRLFCRYFNEKWYLHYRRNSFRHFMEFVFGMREHYYKNNQRFLELGKHI